MDCPKFDIDRQNKRSSGFTEQLCEWNLPLYESNIIVDLAVGEGIVVKSSFYLIVFSTD